MAHPFFILVALAICQSSVHGAPPPPPELSPAAPTNSTYEFLEPHNKARAEVGVNPLQWSDKLAKDASLLVRYQRNNMGCKFATISSSNQYGANQLWSSGRTVTPRMAVESWLEEKPYYNHASNSCAPDHDKCGVYTQVVWGKSIELGCAQATCATEKTTLTICFYYPPGNVVGESPY